MPLSQSDLESLTQAEGDRCEFKESIADRQDIKRSICAFANDLADHRAPGAIFIGLRNDGSCADLEIHEELERTAAAFRSDGSMLPIPSMIVRRVCLRACNILVIEVEPAQSPPVRLSGVVWIRAGSTNQKATPQEEKRLSERVRWHASPFDQKPTPGATLADLDLDLFQRLYLPHAVSPEVLTENDRPLVQQLSSLRLATRDGQPTNAGLLVTGHDPRQWMPCAYLQFVRFDGTALTDPIRDQKEIDGPLPDLMRRLDELLELNVQTAAEITGGVKERRSPDYPIEALRQLTRNAVMHRTYEATNAPVRIYWFSDRIEIHSPGGPYGQVSLANFGKPGVTDYRNPQIAEAMKILGYVQRFGAGFPIARKELENNGNPVLEFELENAFVMFRIRSRS